MSKSMKVLFGRKLAKLRRQAGLTQEKLAERAGYTSANPIGYYEIGQQAPKFENLPKLAKALNVKVSDLFPY